jgi:hypothetical protein
MKKKNQPRMKKEVLKLQKNHTWKAPSGYKIMVVERGVVSFNFPEHWLLKKMEPIEIHDGEPPDDNARLMVSFWRLPPGVDWTGLPLAPMLEKSVDVGEREILSTGKPVTMPRSDMEMVWLEQRFIDPIEKREAYSRICLARGSNVQVLITFDFWADVHKTCAPIWNEVIRSLLLGRYISDPTKGEILH